MSFYLKVETLPLEFDYNFNMLRRHGLFVGVILGLFVYELVFMYLSTKIRTVNDGKTGIENIRSQQTITFYPYYQGGFI